VCLVVAAADEGGEAVSGTIKVHEMSETDLDDYDVRHPLSTVHACL
jgi:hypothetical protein